MNEVLIHSQITGLTEALQGLDGKAIQRGLKHGLGRVGDSVRAKASAKIREAYNLKPADVNSTFKVITAGDAVLIVCKSRPINLTAFGARQLGTRGGKRLTIKRVRNGISSKVRGKAGSFGGVTVPIEKSHTTLLASAFIAKVKAGTKGSFNIGVFSRTSHAAKSTYKDTRNRRKTNRPYVKVVRPLTPVARRAIINRAFVSVSTLFGGKRVAPVIEEYLSNDALKTVLHEISFAMENNQP